MQLDVHEEPAASLRGLLRSLKLVVLTALCRGTWGDRKQASGGVRAWAGGLSLASEMSWERGSQRQGRQHVAPGRRGWEGGCTPLPEALREAALQVSQGLQSSPVRASQALAVCEAPGEALGVERRRVFGLYPPSRAWRASFRCAFTRSPLCAQPGAH